MWIARVRDGFQDVDAESLAFNDLDLCKELLAKFETAGKVQNTAEMVAWKRRRSQQIP